MSHYLLTPSVVYDRSRKSICLMKRDVNHCIELPPSRDRTKAVLVHSLACLQFSFALFDSLTDAAAVRTARCEWLLPARPAAILQPAAAAPAPPAPGAVPAAPVPAEVPAAAGEHGCHPQVFFSPPGLCSEADHALKVLLPFKSY